MITVCQVKSAAIDERRRLRAEAPQQPAAQSTHTIERTFYEVGPPQPSAGGTWSIQDAMRNAQAGEDLLEPMPVPEVSAPVVVAPAAVLIESPDDQLTAAVRSAIAAAADNQRRYELAMQARNGKADAIALIELEARERGLSVADMVQSIIDERTTSERRTMQIIAAEVRWRNALIAPGAADPFEIVAAALAEIAAL